MGRPAPACGQKFVETALAVGLALGLLGLLAAAAPTELSGTVFVGGLEDLMVELQTTNRSKCSWLVDRAYEGEYGFTKLSFLVSQDWVDVGPLTPPPGWPGCDNYTMSEYYCFNRFNSTEVSFWSYETDVEGNNVPDQIDDFSTLLEACLAHAVGLGFDIAVNVHADDGRAENGWRNTLDFNPLERSGNFSYVDAFLNPIADALANVMELRSGTRVWLSLQGEMGATVFFYPLQWVEVAAMVRDRIERGRPELKENVQLGLGINNSKLCGCVLIDIVDGDQYLAAFHDLWPSIQDWFDIEGIRQMFFAVDYIGISAYVAQNQLNFTACDMEMDIELSYYNLNLKELNAAGVSIEFIEFGIGGGTSQDGDQKATTALEAAYWPFWGILGDYTPELDPWTTYDQVHENPVRDYMHYYYSMTSAYLLQGGCDYRVSGVNIWTVSSWDVLGMYPQPPGTNGSYADPGAIQIVRNHNQQVHGPHVALLP